MTAFDYLLPLVSVLIGLALADVATSVHRLLRARARVRWHAFPLAATVLLVLATLDIWWGLRDFSRITDTLTMGAVLPWITEMFVFYLLASAVLPDEVPAEGIDLGQYYFDNARYFWSLYALLLVMFALHRVGIVLAAAGWSRLPDVMISLIPNVVLIVLVTSLAIVKRRAWHGVVIVALLALLLALWIPRPLN